MGILPSSKYTHTNYTLWDWRNNYSICLEILWINHEPEVTQNSVNTKLQEALQLFYESSVISNT